jgi:hypothetical protein
MSTGLMNKIKRGVKPTCVLIAGVMLCIFVFLPLSAVLSTKLFLLGMPTRSGTWLILAEVVTEALSASVSGFLTGVFVSLFSQHRERGTTMLASLVVTVWYVIVLGSISFRASLSGRYFAASLLNISVCAICLLAFAFIGARLVVKRRLQGNSRGHILQ